MRTDAGGVAPSRAERDQFTLLLRNFIRRLFENDLVPESIDLRHSAIWLAAILAMPPSLIAISLTPKYSIIARSGGVSQSYWRIDAVHDGKTLRRRATTTTTVANARTICVLRSPTRRQPAASHRRRSRKNTPYAPTSPNTPSGSVTHS